MGKHGRARLPLEISPIAVAIERLEEERATDYGGRKRLKQLKWKKIPFLSNIHYHLSHFGHLYTSPQQNEAPPAVSTNVGYGEHGMVYFGLVRRFFSFGICSIRFGPFDGSKHIATIIIILLMVWRTKFPAFSTWIERRSPVIGISKDPH